MKAMGQDFKTTLNQTVDLHWSVKTVGSDGVADLSQTIDRVRTKIDAPGNSFEFDSQVGQRPRGTDRHDADPDAQGPRRR